MPIEDNISQSGSSHEGYVSIKDLIDCSEEQSEVFIGSIEEYGRKHDNPALLWIAGDDGFKSVLKHRCRDAVALLVRLCANSESDDIQVGTVKTVLTMACGKALAHSYVAYCRLDGNEEAEAEAVRVTAALETGDTDACGELKRLIDNTYSKVQITFSDDGDECK